VSFVYPAPRPGEATSPPTVMRPVADAVLPCDSSSPAAARHAVQTALHERGADAVSDEAALLVSEVVTNALRHAGSGVAVHIDLGDDAVRVTVTDHGPGWPQRRDATIGGWGLNLVETIATRWGAYPSDDGKSVWFELPL